MLNWLKKLILGLDRTEAASERAAKAMEDIASDLEAARDGLRQRLGIAETREATAYIETPATEKADPAPRNGRRKVTA